MVLFLMITSVGFAYFGCVIIALMAVPAREMRMVSGRNRVFCREMPFCFPVMTRSFFVVVSGVVMMACSWMITGHDCPRAKKHQSQLLEARFALIARRITAALPTIVPADCGTYFGASALYHIASPGRCSEINAFVDTVSKESSVNGAI